MLYATPEAPCLHARRLPAPSSFTSKKRRGHGWKRAKSKLASEATRGPGRPPQAEAHELKIVDGMISSSTKFGALVDKLNSCNWAEHIYDEALYYKKIGTLDKAMELFDVTPVSSYIEQNRGSKTLQLERMCKKGRMILKWCAEATHENNHSIIPFSMAARSVAKIAHKATAREWSESTDVVDKKTALKYVHGQAARRPEPAFAQSLRVFVYVYDQVYRVADNKAKGGKTTAQECVM